VRACISVRVRVRVRLRLRLRLRLSLRVRACTGGACISACGPGVHMWRSKSRGRLGEI